ncbi:glycoside hydrolase family 125 protein [Paenibacillus sp. J5C_2022]|nr:glycoside hydrolase family 125 protein [Paenibacillus sp. J5C2022]MCU6708060.1 glycoside hydrolase family 125 protein [Paenibacillus sp. J5C2022]
MGHGAFSADGIDREKLGRMFEKCFLSTIETTVEHLEDGSVFVITGDIPAMWLRDSAAQVRHYIPFARQLPELQVIIEGLIRKQVFCINTDAYANAFNKEFNGNGHSQDLTESNPLVWERKYEIDSLCYPVQLAYLYWQETGSTTVFDASFKEAVLRIIDLWTVEQRHHGDSPYQFQRFNCPPSDTLRNHGLSMPTNYTGMTWSGFRPSDDACVFGYLIPANMFAVVALRYAEEIFAVVYGDKEAAARAAGLKEEIDYGIQTYGIVNHPKYGQIYAYETDGFGNYHMMDDANVPSLLSIPYLGYASADDSIYANTRKFLLSKDNPYYCEGKYARGIGSPHTPEGFVWHIGMTMQALTSLDSDEIYEIVKMLVTTDGNTDYMHEGFNPDNPEEFTRPWFAWANSLFAELLCRLHWASEPS